MARRFDHVVVVDWSAAGRPVTGSDSIWIARRDRHGLQVTNPATRRQAEAQLGELLAASRAHRTLLGVDFSLGYPAGTAAALGLHGVPWRAMWGLLERLVVDEPSNRNNRFTVAAELNRRITGRRAPFWGAPPSAVTATLGSTKPDGPGPLAEWRDVERCLRDAGFRPFSAWQVLGAGAVGGQSLVGIPALERLRRARRRPFRVWPFEPTDQLEAGAVVVAELWPTLVGGAAGGGPGPRDRMQVVAAADRLWALDGRGALDAMFDGAARAEHVTTEEGWTLGADDPVAMRCAPAVP